MVVYFLESDLWEPGTLNFLLAPYPALSFGLWVRLSVMASPLRRDMAASRGASCSGMRIDAVGPQLRDQRAPDVIANACEILHRAKLYGFVERRLDLDGDQRLARFAHGATTPRARATQKRRLGWSLSRCRSLRLRRESRCRSLRLKRSIC